MRVSVVVSSQILLNSVRIVMMSCEGSPDFFAYFQRADGFYHADVNGQLGLVPGSFLDDYTNGVRFERFKEN